MSYILTLGPTHPAWRGAQRYSLTCAGERVTEVEFVSDYHAHNWAERLPRLDLAGATRRIASLCSNCSVAHTLAFCMALEALAKIEPSQRVHALRAIAAELERATAHLGAASRILWALGMSPQSATLLELSQSTQHCLELLAHKHVAEFILPGGVARDLQRSSSDELLVHLPKLNIRLYQLVDSLVDDQALLNRSVEVASLPRSAAEQYGVRGPIARSSGIARDLRIDQAYGFYSKLSLRVIAQEGGDLYARLVVLLLEGLESLKLVEQLLRQLPDGALRIKEFDLTAGSANAQVEAPRGALRYSVESDGQRLTRVSAEPPRQLDRLLARTLLAGALLDNVPAIIASVDHCPFCAGLLEI